MRKNWFDFDFAIEILPKLIAATEATIILAVAAFLFSLVIGLLLLLLRRTKSALVSRATGFFVEFIRSTPLLVQVYFFFFVLPDVGIRLDPLTTGIVALAVHYGCYMSEVYRSGLESIPIGQWDAVTALGFSRYSSYVWIILPQLIPKIIPPAGNFLIWMIKESPLIAAIGAVELIFVAKDISQDRFQFLEPITMVGIIFLVLSVIGALLIRLAEATIGASWTKKDQNDG